MLDAYVPLELIQLISGKILLLIIPLVVTLIIEGIIALIFLPFLKTNSVLLSVFFINLITNPFLNFFLSLEGISYNLYFLEGLVVLVEFLLLAFSLPKQNKMLLFLLSLIMNLCSVGFGKYILQF